MVDLGLRIENTPDTIHVDKAAHLEIVSVHEALQRAFTAGFGGTAGAAPRTLVVALEGVELVSAMAARASRTDGFDGASIVLVHGGHSPQVFSSPKVKVVRIRFRAALRDGSSVVSQMANHAHGSSFTSLSVGSASASATAAIEDMYVQIAKQLFERTMASLAHPSAQEARWR